MWLTETAEFVWPVATGGYRVQSLVPVFPGRDPLGRTDPEPIEPTDALAPALPAGGEQTQRPLRDPELYLKFVELDGVESFAKFASQYGLLGDPISGTALLGDKEVSYESLALWRHEVEVLRRAVLLWQAIRNDEPTEELTRPYLHPNEGARALEEVSLTEEEFARLVALSNLPLQAKTIARRYQVDSGRHLVGDAGKPEHVEAFRSLAALTTQYVHALSPGIVRWVEQNGRFELDLVPRSLLGGLWSQFTASIVGGSRLRSCKVCGRLFEVGLGGRVGARSDKASCSEGCRAKAYRDRKKRREPSTTV